jgi:hypothetical protein
MKNSTTAVHVKNEEQATIDRLANRFIRSDTSLLQAWKWTISLSDEEPNVKLVAMAFTMFSSPDGTGACPGGRAVQAVTSLHRRTIAKCVKRLVSIGYLSATGDMKSFCSIGRPTEVYNLTIPVSKVFDFVSSGCNEAPTDADFGASRVLQTTDFGASCVPRTNSDADFGASRVLQTTQTLEHSDAPHIVLTADAEKTTRGKREGDDATHGASSLSSAYPEDTSGGCVYRGGDFAFLETEIEVCNLEVVS